MGAKPRRLIPLIVARRSHTHIVILITVPASSEAEGRDLNPVAGKFARYARDDIRFGFAYFVHGLGEL